MLYVVLFFLFFALYLYVVLGGADYGAGIVELFSSVENQKITKKTIYRVMGPVWEANHIWIIIVIVILWVGFPQYYNIMVVHLHIPLTMMLLGVTLRGVAFVFRHYDAIVDDSQKLYDTLFKISSFITPMFLGMIFGGLVSGDIHLEAVNAATSFYDVFIQPWSSIFSILIGMFFTALCAFLSAVLLIGESEQEGKKMYVRKAMIATAVVFLVGGLVFGYGIYFEYTFIVKIIQTPFAIALLGISGILLVPMWFLIKGGNVIWSRFFAGLQVFLILLAAFIAHFPHIILVNGSSVSLLEKIAPDSVISTLAITLLIAGLIVLPGLFHLLKSFKMIKILEKNNP
ncbi:cytochrome d ubiquinol oxidase subunit II [Aquimarina hainanensis]|uniref:Cytochrome d ubiquinol oxidase subunit II n=1 Tax=Aquimarina hainanensis TaxID=1578017 RepID=A0ABW5N6Z1_9FLAO